MYEMLTGALPFSADTATELARLHREELPPSPRQYTPGISPMLEQIQLKVLAKEPAARYRTADQFGRVLLSFRERFLQPAAAAPHHEPPPEPTQQQTTPPPPVRQPNHVQASSAPSNRQVPQPATRPGSTRKTNHQNTENPLDIDWMTIILGLLALVAVGGLFPFYLWVYYIYR